VSNNNKPRAEIRDITPEWAAEILRRHDESIEAKKFNQRPLAKQTVAAYANDMRAGNWSFTGQGISFDCEGNLMDGQHRLAAVVKCGLTIRMLVCWDVPNKSENNMDTIDLFDIGKKRSVGQQLKIKGYLNYFDVASAARCLLMLSQGNLKGAYTLPQQVAVASLMHNNIQNLMTILGANSAKGKFRGCIMAPLALLHTSDRTTAELFATDYNEMTGLSKTSPVIHFHRFMERGTLNMTSGTDYQLRVMSALSSALYSYTNEKRVEHIRGNQEHVEWLLRASRNAVTKIREVAGIEMTMAELKEKG
jgi:hypothetical protein